MFSHVNPVRHSTEQTPKAFFVSIDSSPVCTTNGHLLSYIKSTLTCLFEHDSRAWPLARTCTDVDWFEARKRYLATKTWTRAYRLCTRSARYSISPPNKVPPHIRVGVHRSLDKNKVLSRRCGEEVGICSAGMQSGQRLNSQMTRAFAISGPSGCIDQQASTGPAGFVHCSIRNPAAGLPLA